MSYASAIPVQPPRVVPKLLSFLSLWMVVGMVSAYDIYLSAKYDTELVQYEMNPVGRWLMSLDHGSVSLFLGCKVAGMVLVLGTLMFLYNFRERLAWPAVVALAMFQIGLAWFLTYGEYWWAMPKYGW